MLPKIHIKPFAWVTRGRDAQAFSRVGLCHGCLVDFGNAGVRLRVKERSRLDDALKNGHYDLVLVDVMEAPVVQESLAAIPSSPVVVPIVYEGTKAETEEVKKHYRCLLKTPDKIGNYLDAIDRALDEKGKRDRAALRATK